MDKAPPTAQHQSVMMGVVNGHVINVVGMVIAFTWSSFCFLLFLIFKIIIIIMIIIITIIIIIIIIIIKHTDFIFFKNVILPIVGPMSAIFILLR